MAISARHACHRRNRCASLVQLGALIEWSSMAQFEQSISVNYLGMVRVCKAVLPLLKIGTAGCGRGRRRIINVSSVNGLVSLPGVACYAASKHATEAGTLD